MTLAVLPVGCADSLSEAKLSPARSELFTLVVCRSHVAALQEDTLVFQTSSSIPSGLAEDVQDTSLAGTRSLRP